MSPELKVTRRRAGTTPERVLLLHGLANSSTVWDATLPHWPEGPEIWSADLPWRSGGDPAWSHRSGAVPWLSKVLANVPGPISHIVAHSFSANALLELLSQEIARGDDPVGWLGLRGMVLVSPFYRRDPEDFEWGELPRNLDAFRQTMEDGIRMHSGDRIDPEIRHDMAVRVCERVGVYGWTRFMETYLQTPWLRPDLITVPCLVIAGTHDYSPPVGESIALAEDLADARSYIFDGCGHFTMAERPAEFAAAASGFLAGQLLSMGEER